eukprot:SAG31_NODE_49_length_30599_cov_15.615016_36_plen_62_part_00
MLVILRSGKQNLVTVILGKEKQKRLLVRQPTVTDTGLLNGIVPSTETVRVDTTQSLTPQRW